MTPLERLIKQTVALLEDLHSIVSSYAVYFDKTSYFCYEAFPRRENVSKYSYFMSQVAKGTTKIYYAQKLVKEKNFLQEVYENLFNFDKVIYYYDETYGIYNIKIESLEAKTNFSISHFIKSFVNYSQNLIIFNNMLLNIKYIETILEKVSVTNDKQKNIDYTFIEYTKAYIIYNYDTSSW